MRRGRSPGVGHRCLLDDRGPHDRYHHHGQAFGQARRIEIVFYRLGDDIYLSGIPGPRPATGWPTWPPTRSSTSTSSTASSPTSRPTATVIADPAERRRVLAVFVEEFNRRRGPDSPWPTAVLDEWVERSPLAKVTFVGTD